MIYLVNEPRRTATIGRSARKLARRRRPTAKQLKARERFARMARAKAKARLLLASKRKTRRTGGRMAAKRKRRRKVTAKAAPRRKRRVTGRRRSRVPALALRRRGVTVYRSNGRKRRRYRRNGIGGGIGRSLMSAGKDALAVIAGMAGTNLIAARIPFGGDSTAATAGKKLAVAFGLSLIVGKVGSRGLAEKVLVGGVVSAATDLLRQVPGIGGAIAGDEVASLSSYADVSALPSGSVGSYAGAADPMAAYRN